MKVSDPNNKILTRVLNASCKFEKFVEVFDCMTTIGQNLKGIAEILGDSGDRAAYSVLLNKGIKGKEITGIGRIMFYNVKILVPDREGSFITKKPQTFLGIYEGEIYCG